MLSIEFLKVALGLNLFGAPTALCIKHIAVLRWSLNIDGVHRSDNYLFKHVHSSPPRHIPTLHVSHTAKNGGRESPARRRDRPATVAARTRVLTPLLRRRPLCRPSRRRRRPRQSVRLDALSRPGWSGCRKRLRASSDTRVAVICRQVG